MKFGTRAFGALAVAGAVFFGTVNSQAASYVITETPATILTPGSSTGGTFDLTAEVPPFVPGVDSVLSADLGVVVSRPIGGPVLATLDLDGSLIGGIFVPFFGVINVADGLLSVSLDADGMVDWEVSNHGLSTEPLTLEMIRLSVVTVAGAGGAVPDAGATLPLLGFAILGMGYVSRKMKA